MPSVETQQGQRIIGYALQQSPDLGDCERWCHTTQQQQLQSLTQGMVISAALPGGI